jgi:glycine cleavage system H protein
MRNHPASEIRRRSGGWGLPVGSGLNIVQRNSERPAHPMADVPEELKYTAEHEWARVDDAGSSVRIGITDFAQLALGDVVYVSLPEVGTSLKIGEAFGEVESTKSVSDLYAPVSGIVTGRNGELADNPELVNAEPYGRGWIVEIELSERAQLEDLLDAAAYVTLSG